MVWDSCHNRSSEISRQMHPFTAIQLQIFQLPLLKRGHFWLLSLTYRGNQSEALGSSYQFRRIQGSPFHTQPKGTMDSWKHFWASLAAWIICWCPAIPSYPYQCEWVANWRACGSCLEQLHLPMTKSNEYVGNFFGGCPGCPSGSNTIESLSFKPPTRMREVHLHYVISK